MSLALALDKLGNELLSALSRRVQDRIIIDARNAGLTAAGELRAGDPGLPLSAQSAVYRLAGAESIGVSVTPGQVLHPLKSMSLVLGIGIDLPVAHWSRCDDCPSAPRCLMSGHGARRRLETRAMTTGKPAAASFTLHFPELERYITSYAGETIYQSARRSGVRIIGACGGRGTCDTCRVQIVGGEIDDAGEKRLRAEKKSRWVRACQVTPKSDCTIEIAARSLAPVVRAEFDAGEAVEILPLDAAVTGHDINVPQATLADNLSDLDRVIRRAGDAAASSRSGRGPAIARGFAWRRLVAARVYPRRRVDRVFAGRPANPRPRRRPRHHQCRWFPGRSDKRRAPCQPRHRKPAGGVGRRRHQPHEPCDPGAAVRGGIAPGGVDRDQRARP